MIMKFKNKNRLDVRAKFVNYTCKLFYEKYKDDLASHIKELKQFNLMCDDCVRNVYELIDTQIPLLAWYQIYTSYNDMDLEIDTKTALKICIDACNDYYL